MPTFETQDPHFEARVRESFARQTAMMTLGASLSKVAPGEVEIELPFRYDLSQQHGFIHGGIVTAIMDSACGYAALTLMPTDVAVLTVEFKVNFVAPAAGDRLIARGRVAKPGRILTVCAGEVVAQHDGQQKTVAVMLATIMAVRERPDVSGGL